MERDRGIERKREKVRLLSRNGTRRKCLSWLPGRGASSGPGMEAGKGTENEQASIRASPAPPACWTFGLDSGWNTDQKEKLLPQAAEKRETVAESRETERRVPCSWTQQEAPGNGTAKRKRNCDP